MRLFMIEKPSPQRKLEPQTSPQSIQIPTVSVYVPFLSQKQSEVPGGAVLCLPFTATSVQCWHLLLVCLLSVAWQLPDNTCDTCANIWLGRCPSRRISIPIHRGPGMVLSALVG